MADNVAVTAGVGTTIAADEVVDATLGTVKVQYVKLMSGTLDGTEKAAIGVNGLAVDVKALPALAAGNNNIGDVDVASLPALAAGTNMIGHVGGTEYEFVAASATDQALGATGATGDYLAHVLIIPATTSPGAVSIKDGAGSARTIFTGGASSVSNLVPFAVPICAKSSAGAWSITTGANVSAFGFGDFT